MMPFKLLKKYLHVRDDHVLYESNWQETSFRFGNEDSAWQKKRELEEAMNGKMKYKVMENE